MDEFQNHVLIPIEMMMGNIGMVPRSTQNVWFLSVQSDYKKNSQISTFRHCRSEFIPICIENKCYSTTYLGFLHSGFNK